MIRKHGKVAALLAVCGAVSLAAAPARAQTDAQILGAQLAANQGEVTLGQWVSQNTQNAAVRQYADMLATDHAAGVQQVQSTIQSTSIQPDPNAQQQKTQEAQASLQRLQAMSGDAMDRAFIAHAIEDHQKDIAEANRQVAHASNPAVRTLVSGMLPTLRKHLAAARQVRAGMAGTSSGGGQQHMSVHKDNGR